MKRKEVSFTEFQLNLVLITTGLVTAMGFVDITALNVALPFIQESLRASATDIHWVLEIYLLFLAALTLVGGAIGDVLGRRRPLRWGIIIFALASLGCALSFSSEMLILFRAFQGIGAAIMIPASLALINSSFEPKKRGEAIGKWSAIVALTIPLGPVLGGIAVDYLSWHYVFVINLPICFTAICFLKFIPRPKYERKKSIPIDLQGSLIITISLSMITFSLLESGREGNFSLEKIFILLIGFLLFLYFFWFEGKIKNPMFPVDLLNNRRFLLVTSQTFLLFAGFQSAMYFLGFLYIQSYDYTALEAGAATLPISIIVGIFSRFSGKYVSKHGPRLILFLSGISMMVGLFILSFSNENYWISVLPGILFLGISVVLFAAPLTTVAMSAAGPGRDGLASGVSNAVSRIGPLLAVAFYSYWIGIDYSKNLIEYTNLNLLPTHVKEYLINTKDMLAAVQMEESWPSEIKYEIEVVVKELFANSIKKILKISAFLAFLVAIMSLLYKKNDANINEKP